MENINDKVGTANTTYVGVGHGLQIRYGPHAGRLVRFGKVLSSREFIFFLFDRFSLVITLPTSTTLFGILMILERAGRPVRPSSLRWMRPNWWNLERESSWPTCAITMFLYIFNGISLTE